MDKDQMKSKHVNIRVTPEMLEKIDDVHINMENELQVVLSRSQVMQRLIQLGIEKYQNVEV
jgi:hypothetical protein